jgi:hypothetical protein
VITQRRPDPVGAGAERRGNAEKKEVSRRNLNAAVGLVHRATAGMGWASRAGRGDIQFMQVQSEVRRIQENPRSRERRS